MSNLMKVQKAVLWHGALGVAIGVLLFSGCGADDGNSRSTNLHFASGSIAWCLKEGGARFAESADDLSFLLAAEEEESIAKAFTYEKAPRLFIDIWSKFPSGGQPSEWLAWIGQPVNQDNSPLEIVEKSSPDSYVAYVINPTNAERRAVKACTV